MPFITANSESWIQKSEPELKAFDGLIIFEHFSPLFLCNIGLPRSQAFSLKVEWSGK